MEAADAARCAGRYRAQRSLLAACCLLLAACDPVVCMNLLLLLCAAAARLRQVWPTMRGHGLQCLCRWDTEEKSKCRRRSVCKQQQATKKKATFNFSPICCAVSAAHFESNFCLLFLLLLDYDIQIQLILLICGRLLISAAWSLQTDMFPG